MGYLCQGSRASSYKYIGAYRDSLPVYASGNFHGTVKEYVDEALYYQSKGIPGYKAHPGGPVSFDMEVHQAIRDAVGPDYLLMTDPVGDYTINEAVTVGRQLERLNYKWLEEPFRDFELYKYTELCRTLDIPIAATETTRGCHWGVAQVIRSARCRYRPRGCQLEGRHYRHPKDRTWQKHSA